ncbi:hypothetical protein [Plantactinospora sp. GCM10030261]|uniref:hypothetical protein n=1 Tax=Plantactinospora sp. GCM10030261 TaxID=3273420 RepID=UPI00360D3249
MDLAPYLESLRRDLAAAAAPGGPDVVRAADLLAGSLDAAIRLCLLDVLSDAAAEITAGMDGGAVEVRLRGREAQLVVNEPAAPERPAPPPAEPTGDVTRITLRLPESLKEGVERAAAADGLSVNNWLVRAATAALHGQPPTTGRPGRPGRRVTGFAQA